MEFSLLTLGTASALPTAYRYPSAHILTVRGRLFLIDCGEGAQMQMRRFSVPIPRIDTIFISHLHGDHTFGLFGLISSLSMMGKESPLVIYAPQDFSRMIEFFIEYFGEGLRFPINHVVVSCKEKSLIAEFKELDVFAFPLLHRGEAYGYLFKEREPSLNVKKYLIEKENLSLYEIARLKEGLDITRENGEVLLNKDFTYLPYTPRSFAYCTDTLPLKRIAKWIDGVDILYHDSTYTLAHKSMAKANLHSTSYDAAVCAKAANAKKLLLGHFSSRYKDLSQLLSEAKEVFENSELAKEGALYPVPLNRISY